MTGKLKVILCAALSAGTIFAQTPESTSGPVAYVYLALTSGYAAAADGKLTPIHGATLQGDEVVATKTFVFALNQTQIKIYKIGAGGALSLAVTTHYIESSNWCSDVITPMQVDVTGKTLYVSVDDCRTADQIIESFAIESNGSLKYLGASTPLSEGADEAALVVLGNNKYAYLAGDIPGPDQSFPTPFTKIYTRESDGFMQSNSAKFPLPKPYRAHGYYAAPSPPQAIAADGTDHIVLAWKDVSVTTGQWSGPEYLASYTADSHGNLSSTNTLAEMAQSDENDGVSDLKISPSGKYLAVAGTTGFQVFHFNGAAPITHFTGLILPNAMLNYAAWDKDNHIYTDSYGTLYVYTVTPAGVEAAPGGPYNVPGSFSPIVVVSR